MVASSPRRDRGHRSILITGTPGTGKRSVGAFLAEEWGFEHVHLAEPALEREALQRMLTLSEQGVLRYVVVTCARAWPAECVDLLYALEVEWVWFDGDRGALRPRSFELIDPSGRRMTVDAPRFVDPFDPAGFFRPLEAVVADVLDPDHGAASRALEHTGAPIGGYCPLR